MCIDLIIYMKGLCKELIPLINKRKCVILFHAFQKIKFDEICMILNINQMMNLIFRQLILNICVEYAVESNPVSWLLKKGIIDFDNF